MRNSHILNIYSCFLIVFLLGSCITPYEPAVSFEDKQKEREKKIETYAKKKALNEENSSSVYESLGYGNIYVYRPPIFHSLDSLYAIKDSLIQENNQRQIVESDLELFIEEYRGKAKEESDEIRYETEHIYCLRGEKTHTIYSEFFYLDYQDSIISTFEKFKFQLPRKDYSMYKNYLFEMHFTTPRDLFISQSELDFIKLFKAKESDLYKTDEHEKFIQHTLRLMNIASAINTVDYLTMTRLIGEALIKEKTEDAEIVDIGSLIALEDNYQQVIGYELNLTWKNKELDKNVASTIEFDPYLRIINFNEHIQD